MCIRDSGQDLAQPGGRILRYRRKFEPERARKIRGLSLIHISTTHVLSVDHKRLKVLHHLHRGSDDKLIATGAQTHVHVNTEAGKASAMDEDLYQRVESLRAAQPEPVPI